VKLLTIMKKMFIVAICLLGISAVQAQSMGSDYKTALGFKVYPGAISIKHFTKSNVAIEGLGYFWNYGSRITGLYEFHGNVNGAPGLKWYAGQVHILVFGMINGKMSIQIETMV
jgi:hypothetical protein